MQLHLSGRPAPHSHDGHDGEEERRLCRTLGLGLEVVELACVQRSECRWSVAESHRGAVESIDEVQFVRARVRPDGQVDSLPSSRDPGIGRRVHIEAPDDPDISAPGFPTRDGRSK
jgi:hypothetical protein